MEKQYLIPRGRRRRCYPQIRRRPMIFLLWVVLVTCSGRRLVAISALENTQQHQIVTKHVGNDKKQSWNVQPHDRGNDQMGRLDRLHHIRSSSYKINATSNVLENDDRSNLGFGTTHIIRRLYGEEAASVRKEISILEERMPRYQTGMRSDPDHIVPYRNHPFDRPDVRKRRQQYRRNVLLRRQLQDSSSNETETNTTETNDTSTANDNDDVETGDDTTETDTTNGDIFQPMRVSFYTKALDDIRDGDNAAKIDWYKSVILPKAAEFWAQALSVVPVSDNLRISSSDLDSFTYCGDSEFTAVPNEHKSTGVADADLILYVSGSASDRFCPDRTLAVAVPCNFDQFDRPTAGAVNVCLNNIELQSDGTASPAVEGDYVDVTIHEVGHVLGHSANSYRFFWDPDTGIERTERPFETRSVTCVNGETKSLILPGESTMVFVEDKYNRRYASIVTPKVKSIAQNQFDCPTLEGGRLENQPTRADSCMGDHWDERFFYPEAMSGVISPTTNILSSLTLALLEDSGWYKANYTVSRMSPWGLGMGCNFVDEPCLVSSSGTSNSSGGSTTTVPDYGRGFFCKDEEDKGCSSEHTHKMACTILDYYYFVPQELPEVSYQYFPDMPTTGGPRQADFCPVYGSVYNNLKANQLECKNADNTPSINVYSEVFGPERHCIESSVGEGLCYRTACIKEEMAVRINVLGEWLRCEYDFQPQSILVGQGLLRTTIFCPRLAQVCPDLFCPFNCAGRGVCNYSAYTTVVDNVTITHPKCECFDTSDTSEGCSDSQIPNGNFLDDSSGLFDNIEENFFDPLISIFVDHPDAWTSASWAWAGGLLTVFVILLLCICSSVLPMSSSSTNSQYPVKQQRNET